jgi:hypothetical protein
VGIADSAYGMLAGASEHADAADGSNPPVWSARRDLRTAPRPQSIVVTPDMVADLYEPALIITADYVGRDRRQVERSASRPGRGAHRYRLRTVVLSIVATIATIAPLGAMAMLSSITPSTTTLTHHTAPRSAGQTARGQKAGSSAGARRTAQKRATGAARPQATGRHAKAAPGAVTANRVGGGQRAARVVAGQQRRAVRALRIEDRRQARVAARAAAVTASAGSAVARSCGPGSKRCARAQAVSGQRQTGSTPS